MRIKIKVKAASKKPVVTRRADGMLCVKVDALPQKGKANRRLIEILSKHFGVSKSEVTIVHGAGEPVKLVEIGKR
ncbi:MAG: DUF167 domain-containing protein [Elusimicrobiota bacterium]|nr:DUF167 domain-containing protein [Elusimicrobiota bacterium]